MKSLLNGIIICVICAGFSANLSAAKKAVDWEKTAAAYDVFLSKPSSSHARKFARTLSGGKNLGDSAEKGRKEAVQRMFAEEKFAHFMNIIKTPKPAYLQAAFALLQISETNYSDMIEAAMGEYASKKPEAFLDMARSATEFQLRGMFGNFDPGYADDHMKQLNELISRYQAIEKVKKKKYSKARNKCLEILKVFIEEKEASK